MDREQPPAQRRLIGVVAEIDERQPYGQKLSDLASMVMERHQPDPCYAGEGRTVLECTGHFGNNEEQHPWPCEEVIGLAYVLGVPL